MEKKYYDILQVNKNASPEIIEKAYKVLAKKYHPDLQPEENKKQAEDILKEINEAYEVLSNPEKRQNYNASLLQEEQQNHASYGYEKKVDTTKTSSASSQKSQQHHPNNYETEKQNQVYQEQLRYEQELSYQEQLQQARQKAYHDAYIQDLKNRGYKIRYRKSFKDYFNTFIAIVLTILVLFLIYQIPFVKHFFTNLYEENEIFRLFIDVIINFFK